MKFFWHHIRFFLLAALISYAPMPVSYAQDKPAPTGEAKPASAIEKKKSPFWKTPSQVMNNPHVFTARIGTFYNRIDGDQASTQSEGFFLSSPSFILGFDWEYQQSSGWSTLMSAGFRLYRYKRSIEPDLFRKDYTFLQPELWMGMGKRFASSNNKPMMLKLYVGNYGDHYYFAPTFNSLAFEADRLIAVKTQFDWTVYRWNHNKEVGVEVFAQVMRRGQFLRGGSEFGTRILFGLYPLRMKYELSASYMKTAAHKYRMLEAAILFEYLFGK